MRFSNLNSDPIASNDNGDHNEAHWGKGGGGGERNKERRTEVEKKGGVVGGKEGRNGIRKGWSRWIFVEETESGTSPSLPLREARFGWEAPPATGPPSRQVARVARQWGRADPMGPCGAVGGKCEAAGRAGQSAGPRGRGHLRRRSLRARIPGYLPVTEEPARDWTRRGTRAGTYKVQGDTLPFLTRRRAAHLSITTKAPRIQDPPRFKPPSSRHPCEDSCAPTSVRAK